MVSELCLPIHPSLARLSAVSQSHPIIAPMSNNPVDYEVEAYLYQTHLRQVYITYRGHLSHYQHPQRQELHWSKPSKSDIRRKTLDTTPLFR